MNIYTEQNNLSVIGLGYVGLPLAVLADRQGYKVTGVDICKEKVDLINKGIVPFIDKNLAISIKASRVFASTDFSLINNSDIIIICVPTPVHSDHRPDLTPVIGSCESISKFLKKGQLVILESTVNPGVSEEVVLPILERGSNLKCGVDFHLAHCPERINPGDIKYDVSNIARVVGSTSTTGLEMALNFYRSIISADIKPMKTIKEAEAVKIVENCFRDVNIAFVNELAMSFSKLGIDIKNVIEGASTKPYSFMPHYPGCGVGGHCIAVDPYYLIEYARTNFGFEHRLLSLSREINNGMPEFTVDTLIGACKEKDIDPKTAKIAVLGLSYKADIDDCRESPSFEVIEHLAKVGGIPPRIFDPYVKKLSNVETLEEAVKNADAVVITTAHKEFKALEPDYLISKGIKIVIDGRNCLDKDKYKKSTLVYHGIGR